LVIPFASAYAEFFAVTTNKDIYAADEKAIIVGVVPEDAPVGYAVLVKVTGPEGIDCSLQNLLPASDGSFVSRPVRLDDCGVGDYTVSAYYADMNATSTFAVSNSSQTAAGNRLELRLIKNVVLETQQAVSLRLKELIESNHRIPEEIAQEYSNGVSEASLVLEAAEFGNTADAKKHMILTMQHFRGVLNALSLDRALFDMTAEHRVASDDRSSVLERLNRLEEFHQRLQELAKKNSVDKARELENVAALLASTRQMIKEGDIDGSRRNLEMVYGQLEEIRADLFKENESLANTSSTEKLKQDDERMAKRLTNIADRFEKKALDLLNETGSMPKAAAKIEDALSFLAGSRTSIDEGNYPSAKDFLSKAINALNDAKKLIEEKNDSGDNAGSNNSSDDSSASGDDGSNDSNSEGDKGNNDKETSDQ
jgi:hypothetical protein